MAMNIYWGDPHGHSGYSECYWKDTDFPSIDPIEYYANAMKYGKLDFATLTDHDLNLSSEEWKAIVDATNESNVNGKFATILGYEWTSAKYGHQNIYFSGDSGKLIKCRHGDSGNGELPKMALWSPSQPADWMVPTTLWKYLEGKGGDIITVPHHVGVSQMPYDWNYHSTVFQPVTEITSLWGNFESPDTDIDHGISDVLPDRYVRDALNRGYRLGFIGGGDSHDGHPGERTFGNRRKKNFVEGQNVGSNPIGRSAADYISTDTANTRGLTAVIAPELSRDAIFGAIAEKRCYATTGARIIVDFTVNGRVMGSELLAGNSDIAHISIKVKGEGTLNRVELVKNNGVAARWAPKSSSFAAEITDRPGPGVTWYYLRVLQKDGHRAWSSPVWFERNGRSPSFTLKRNGLEVINSGEGIAFPHIASFYSSNPKTIMAQRNPGSRRRTGYNFTTEYLGADEFVVGIDVVAGEEEAAFSGDVEVSGASMMRIKAENLVTVKYGGDLYAMKGSRASWHFAAVSERKSVRLLIKAKKMSSLLYEAVPRIDGKPAPAVCVDGRQLEPREYMSGCFRVELLRFSDKLRLGARTLSSIKGHSKKSVPVPERTRYVIVRPADEETSPLKWPEERLF